MVMSHLLSVSLYIYRPLFPDAAVKQPDAQQQSSPLRMLGAKVQQETPRSWAFFSAWSWFMRRSHKRRSPYVEPVINI